MKKNATIGPFLRVSILALAVAALGCGNKDSADPAPATPRDSEAQLFEQQGLAGSWESGCVAREQRSERDTIFFKGDQVTITWTLFLVPGCLEDKKGLQFETTNHQSFIETQPDIADWKTINSMVQAVTVTMLSQEMTVRYNRGARYEISDWKEGEGRDVAGKKFAADSTPELKVGDVRVRTFLVEGDILHVAKYEGNTALRSDDAGNTFKRK